jgi:membrane-associated phospholipid phosphatase
MRWTDATLTGRFERKLTNAPHLPRVRTASLWFRRLAAASVIAAAAGANAQELPAARSSLPAFEEPNTVFVLRGGGRDPFETLFKADADPSGAVTAGWPPGTETRRPTTSSWADDPGRRELAYSPRLDLSSAQTPAPHTHTGFKALAFETGADFIAYPRRRSTWVILAIGGGAAAIAHPFDDDVNARLAGSNTAGKFFAAGKYIGAVYTQAGVAVGLYAVGRYMLPHKEGGPKTNKVSHLGFDLLRALFVSQGLTQGIKFAAQRDRPTGECCAFPSGHASAAFATASVLERHLGYRGSWPMFLIAGYVATSRLQDNRHYLSDVLFGAAVGISSGWTVVGRHGRLNFALAPVAVPGGMMLALTRKAPEHFQVR